MTDIYKTPESKLTESAALEGFGSLETGIAGQYEFSVREIIKESWAKTSGSKGTIWLALLLYLVVFIPVSMVIPFILELIGLSSQIEQGQEMTGAIIMGLIISQILIMAITLPLGMGLFMIGLKFAVGTSVSATEVFSYFSKILPLLMTVILMYILIFIGFLLLVIPGIYLMFAYYMALPLVVEKGLSPWQALEASRKAISKRWFRFAGLGIAFMLIMLVSFIPLGIGMIWTIPMALIAYGIAYRNIFGFEGEVEASA